MAKKPKYNPEDVERWVTVRGARIPIMKDGSFGVGEKSENPVSLERKLAESMKKYNHPDADREAYNMIQAYKKGQIPPEDITSWGISKDELKSLSEQGRKEAQADIDAGRNKKKVIDPMGNVVKKKIKTDYEKNYGVELKPTSKNAKYDTSKATNKNKIKPTRLEAFKENSRQMVDALKEGERQNVLEVHYTHMTGQTTKHYWNGVKFDTDKIKQDMAKKYGKKSGVYKAKFKKPKEWE